MIYRPAGPLSWPRGSELSFAELSRSCVPFAFPPFPFLSLSSPLFSPWPSSFHRCRDRTSHRALLPLSPALQSHSPRPNADYWSIYPAGSPLYFIRSDRNVAERSRPPSERLSLSLFPSFCMLSARLLLQPILPASTSRFVSATIPVLRYCSEILEIVIIISFDHHEIFVLIEFVLVPGIFIFSKISVL